MFTVEKKADDLLGSVHGIWMSRDGFQSTALHPSMALALAARSPSEAEIMAGDLREAFQNEATAWGAWAILYEGSHAQGRQAQRRWQ